MPKTAAAHLAALHNAEAKTIENLTAAMHDPATPAEELNRLHAEAATARGNRYDAERAEHSRKEAEAMTDPAATPGYDVYEGRANRPPTPATELRDEQLRLALSAMWLDQPRRNELIAECQFRGIEPPTRSEPMPQRNRQEEARRRVARKHADARAGIDSPPDRHDEARDRQTQQAEADDYTERTTDELLTECALYLPAARQGAVTELRARFDELYAMYPNSCA